MDAARRLEISREIDADLERRIAARTYRVEPEPRDTRTAAESKELHDHAWTNWANALIDAKIRDYALFETLHEFAKGVGAALAKTNRQATEVIAATRDEAVELLRGEISTAIAAARDEFRTSLEATKVEMAIAIRQEISATLKRSVDRRMAAELRELRAELRAARPRESVEPAMPRPLRLAGPNG
jgi:hypothetical protein